ncbi:uncharacterized protein DFL_005501 [Arthrobotrys flagrans]|uniref:C2H2-type domain-containing protein n=1 Tax=Arthrobotrys flagrans TaxID=97331 RepID=A0A436ZYD2_ARTFL|nr:hypothetical protein DFL_005501 [Arthrobotrys flagrans]
MSYQSPEDRAAWMPCNIFKHHPERDFPPDNLGHPFDFGGLEGPIDPKFGEGRHQSSDQFEDTDGHYSPTIPFLLPYNSNEDLGFTLPQFACNLDSELYHLWLVTSGHQDGAINRLTFLSHGLELMKTGYIYSAIETANLQITSPIYDEPPPARSTPLNININPYPVGIPEGVVADPPIISPLLSPTQSTIPPLSDSPFQTIYTSSESPETQPEPTNDEEKDLGRADFESQVEEISTEQARSNRSQRQAVKGVASRSAKKRQADRNRVEKNASGVKPRKDRIKCPEPTCTTTWSNQKHLQNHLGEHGIRLFLCKLCGADFPRFDNAINHLKTKLDLKHTENRQNLLAIRRFAKQSGTETNSRSSESLTPSLTNF